MQKQAFIKAVIIMLAFASCIRADVSVIVNGGFEDDEGEIYPISPENAPNGWDVNVPAGKFRGYVGSEWATRDSTYNLTFFSYGLATFNVNDIAMVSQQVNLADVNDVNFDLRLDTDGDPWDPNKRSALILIDDIVVWNSDWNEPDENGEYRYKTVSISGKYDDRGTHKLSLGISIDVNEASPGIRYYTDWDSIGFDLHCDGFGFLDGDFTRDCYVNANDLRMLAQVWLQEVDPNDKYNLFSDDDLEPYGVINFHDFAVYSETWDGNTVDLKNFVDVWLDEVEPNDVYNLFSADDLEPNGVINFFDFAVFAEDWQRSSFD